MFNSSIKLTLILYKWNPGPLNLLIVQIKTCFPSPEVTVFLYFALGFLKQKMARKPTAQNKAKISP